MGLRSLVQVLCLWALAFGRSGPLALITTWTGTLTGPGDAGPTRGLDATEDGNLLLETGSHAGTCASLGSSIWNSVIQCSTAHGFRMATWRLGAARPRPWRGELLWEGRDSETHRCTFQREWKSIRVTDLRTNKKVRNFWARFWLVAFWRARAGLDLVEEQDSKQECSRCPPPVLLEPRY